MVLTWLDCTKINTVLVKKVLILTVSGLVLPLDLSLS